MRLLNIASGLAVLFTTLAFAHMLHHFFTHAGDTVHNPIFVGGMILAVLIGILSLVGGCLLLRRGR